VPSSPAQCDLKCNTIFPDIENNKSLTAAGKCKHYISKHNWCGNTSEYSTNGTDCTKCNLKKKMTIYKLHRILTIFTIPIFTL